MIKILNVDNYGNELYIRDKVIYLKLKEENRTRKLAVIRADYLFITRDYNKHRHRKSNSYGFNDHVLKMAKRVKFINLSDQFHSYYIPIKFILSQGQYLFFKEKGMERQLFISIDLLNEFVVGA